MIANFEFKSEKLGVRREEGRKTKGNIRIMEEWKNGKNKTGGGYFLNNP